MKLDLPSGGWVEYRETLKAMDRFAVQDAVSLVFEEGGNRASLGLANDLRNALLGRIIEKWSFPVSVPSQAPWPADVVIGEAMDIDDYNALAEAVQPLLDKIQGNAEKDKPDPKKRLKG